MRPTERCATNRRIAPVNCVSSATFACDARTWRESGGCAVDTFTGKERTCLLTLRAVTKPLIAQAILFQHQDECQHNADDSEAVDGLHKCPRHRTKVLYSCVCRTRVFQDRIRFHGGFAILLVALCQSNKIWHGVTIVKRGSMIDEPSVDFLP